MAAAILCSLAACSSKPAGTDTPASAGTTQSSGASQSSSASGTETESGGNDAAPSEATEAPAASGSLKAANGVITISLSQAAVVVKGTAVPMPYALPKLEAAGVPVDESYSDIELSSGDFYTLNLYLDANEDYLLMPAYYNGGDDTISITAAEAEEITMTTYADEPVDQGVSIFGVSFGTERSEVISLLGEPSYDAGSYLEWEVAVSDSNYEGTLSMYLTDETDSGAVSQIDLTLFEA